MDIIFEIAKTFFMILGAGCVVVTFITIILEVMERPDNTITDFKPTKQFFYQDKVLVLKGFYTGSEGVVIAKQHDSKKRDTQYLVSICAVDGGRQDMISPDCLALTSDVYGLKKADNKKGVKKQ